MQELERDARQRIPEQDAGNDDFALGWFCASHDITAADCTSINTLLARGGIENDQTVSISLPQSRSQDQPADSDDKSNLSNNRPIHQIARAPSAASTVAATTAPSGTATITPRNILTKKNTRPNSTAAGTRAKPKTSTDPSMNISRCPMTSIPPTCCRPVCIQAGNSNADAFGMTSETRFSIGTTIATPAPSESRVDSGMGLSSGNREKVAVASNTRHHCTPVRIAAGASSSPSTTCQPRNG